MPSINYIRHDINRIWRLLIMGYAKIATRDDNGSLCDEAIVMSAAAQLLQDLDRNIGTQIDKAVK